MSHETSLVSKVMTAAIACLCVSALCIAGLYYRFVPRSDPEDPGEPIFPGLGAYSRKITTRSARAQQYFDQGLAFLYGFDHEEAIRSFEAATVCDPECAIAFWGIAAANGPHINNMSVTAGHAAAALNALGKARALAGNATPVERAMIEAMSKRYSDQSETKTLDEAYAAAMRKLWEAFPNDPDVGALAAEALLDLRPWKQWTVDGKPAPGTAEIINILNAVLEQSPKHPFALHLLIHAVEASPHPENADAAADRLRDLAPGLEHLNHMPSHVDVRRGRWQEAIIANEKAIASDQAYWKISRRAPVYSVAMAHNYHMLIYAAIMQGESSRAMHAAEEMLSRIPDKYLKGNAASVDGFVALRYEVFLRFGLWDAMLSEAQPIDGFPIATSLWRFGRGVSFAATKRIEQAKTEREAFIGARDSVPEGARFRRMHADKLLNIADKVLAGEILYREGKVQDALSILRQGVECEDALPYAEPANWIVPVRHTLGATLVDAARYAEAEIVYRQDLVRHPENGWSLFGLARSLRAQHKTAEAATLSTRFDKSWQYADVKLSSSCFCLQGKEKAEP